MMMVVATLKQQREVLSCGVLVSDDSKRSTAMARLAWTIRPRFVLTALMVFSWGCFVGVSPADIVPSDRMLTEQEGLSVKDGVKPRGLLGLWHLDGDTTDASGNGHQGILVGSPTVIPDGVAGQAYHFDGNDAIDVGDLAFAS